MNANFESIAKIHGKDKAAEVLRRIEQIGHYGNGMGMSGGGLDLAGVLTDSNDALSSKEKDEIAKLAGVTRAKATATVDDKTAGASSRDKMGEEAIRLQEEGNERLRKQREQENK